MRNARMLPSASTPFRLCLPVADEVNPFSFPWTSSRIFFSLSRCDSKVVCSDVHLIPDHLISMRFLCANACCVCGKYLPWTETETPTPIHKSQLGKYTCVWVCVNVFDNDSRVFGIRTSLGRLFCLTAIPIPWRIEHYIWSLRAVCFPCSSLRILFIRTDTMRAYVNRCGVLLCGPCDGCATHRQIHLHNLGRCSLCGSDEQDEWDKTHVQRGCFHV